MMMRVHGGRLLTRTTSTVILGSQRGIQLVFWIVRMSSFEQTAYEKLEGDFDVPHIPDV